MTIHGITPGPAVMTKNPGLFWGMIVSMWIGNVMLLILNLPLIGIWVKLLSTPYRLLYPAILLFCAVGVYSVRNSVFDIGMMTLFGLIGYVLIRLEADPAPLLLGLVLGPMMEQNLRRAMVIADGDWTVFFTKPISAALLAAAAALVVMIILPNVRRATARLTAAARRIRLGRQPSPADRSGCRSAANRAYAACWDRGSNLAACRRTSRIWCTRSQSWLRAGSEVNS